MNCEMANTVFKLFIYTFYILNERLLRFFNIDIGIPAGNIPMGDSPTSI